MASSPDNAAGIEPARDPQSLFRQSLKDLDDRLLRGEPFSGHERNCLFLNTGAARWAGVSHVSGFDFDDDNRALAATDWDGDGDVDVWMANRTAPMVRFLRNDTPRAGDFLTLKLTQDAGNRDALGARVTVKLKTGAPLVREVRAGDSFLSQSSLRLHFGLGQKAEITGITVRWPGGPEENFTGARPNNAWVLRKGAGMAAKLRARAAITPLTTGPVKLPPGEIPVTAPLTQSIPLPRVDFTDLSGKPHQSGEWKGAPVFVSLVSGDYEACAAQFASWRPRLEELQKSGLRIFAAGMDNGKETRALLGALPDFMQRGILTPQARERVEALYNQPFEIRLSPGAPAGFTLDANVRLLTVFRGPATVEQLLAEGTRAALPAADLESFSLPFAGTWFRPPTPWAPLELFPVMLRQNDWSAAHDFMMTNREEFRHSRRYPAAAKVLADALIAQNLTIQALPHYEDAVKEYPGDPVLLNNLAYCLIQVQPRPSAENLTSALTHATRAVEITSRKDAALLDTLARVQLAAGKKQDAAATVEAALALEHTAPEVQRGLEALRGKLKR